MSNTPNLDSELLRFRRRIGDIKVKEDGSLFIDGDPNSGLDKDGDAVTALELLDIYNNAIREFQKKMIVSTPQHRWSEMMPGYVVSSSYNMVTVLSSLEDELYADYLDVFTKANVGNYNILKIIQIAKNSNSMTEPGEAGFSVGVEFPPGKIAEIEMRVNSVYINQFMWTILNTKFNDVWGKYVVAFPKSSEGTGSQYYRVTFLKQHENFIQDDVDHELLLSDFSPTVLDIVIDFAQREYIMRRQFTNPDITKELTDENLQFMRSNK